MYLSDQLDQVVTAFAGQDDVTVSEAKGSRSFEDRRSSDRRSHNGGYGESRSGGYRGGDRGSDRRPSSTAGNSEKPWRNRELSDRNSRPSAGTSDRRSSGPGYKGKRR